MFKLIIYYLDGNIEYGDWQHDDLEYDALCYIDILKQNNLIDFYRIERKQFLLVTKYIFHDKFIFLLINY